MRSVMYAISLALLGKGVILPEFPFMPHVRAIGLSDWDGYALPLANKINYKNTYYHQEPKLDIMSIDPLLSNTVDILISSDVFEHVAPPVQVAFRNSYELLCSGGKLILTVPYTLSDDTIEHFPNMYKHQIRNDNGKYVVDNITRDGKVEIYEDLTFHGGDGNTLEMRIFSLSILLGMLSDVGFKDIMILQEPVFEYGIYFKDHLSLPVLATKP
jgi:SAM-dependent methyltransferase